MNWEWLRRIFRLQHRAEPAPILASAQAAANWWAERLNKEPQYETPPPEAMVLMRLLREPYADDQVAAFRAALARLVSDTLRGRIRKRGAIPQVRLKFAYHPDDYLDAAARAAGIRGPLPFTFDTTMWVHVDRVGVSVGRMSPAEPIYPAPNQD